MLDQKFNPLYRDFNVYEEYENVQVTMWMEERKTICVC